MSDVAATAEASLPATLPQEGEVLAPEKRGRGRPVGLPKTGGRQKGIIDLHVLKPGMTTRELRDHVAAICAARGFDPISTMCLIAKNRKADEKLRFKVAAEVAGYLYPRVKTVELTGADGGPMQMALGVAAMRDWLLSLPDE
jgi:hypothetical protein